MKSERIRFSKYAQPQVRAGTEVLAQLTLTQGKDRIDYIQGMVRILNERLRLGFSIESVIRLRDTHLFGPQYIEFNNNKGKITARPVADLERRLDFNVNNLGVLIADGRHRRLESMIYFPSGSQTARLATLMQSLSQGPTVREIQETAEQLDIEFDSQTVHSLIEKGLLEKIDAGSVSPIPSKGPDAVTWLGHAWVMFESSGKAIWFDPFIRPDLSFQEGEAAELFSDQFAEKRLIKNYGETYTQYGRSNLPVPAAVFITHQDQDHFDLATLLGLPPTTVIYVPENLPTRPWEVDLKLSIKRCLGSRHPVVKLHHGQTVAIGSLKVTAFPFRGEFPDSLPHSWNTYLVETDRFAAAVLADSGVGKPEVEYLSERLSGDRTSLLLSFIVPERDRTFPYMTNYIDSTGLRLEDWYIRTADFFAPRSFQPCGIRPKQLATLARTCGLEYFMPYAHGSTPMWRLPSKVFACNIHSMTLEDLLKQQRLARHAGVNVPAMRYGEPFPLGRRSRRRRPR